MHYCAWASQPAEMQRLLALRVGRFLLPKPDHNLPSPISMVTIGLDLGTVQVGQRSSWDTHYWIAFQLSRGSRQILGVTAPTGGLQITSRDVNGDSFLDVVVTTAWTNRPVAVLLNDGQGNLGLPVHLQFREPSPLLRTLGSPLLMSLRTLLPSLFPAIPPEIVQRAAGFRHFEK